MIIVVSGLPRSGTSAMMQLLGALDVPLLIDERRAPDASNPRGYYEWDPVRQLRRDPGLLAHAEGKALKIVSPLLYTLPPDRTYRVIFMTRRLSGIMASQSRMLKSAGRPLSWIGNLHMALEFRAHLRRVRRWLHLQPNIECLYVAYEDLLTSPLNETLRVAQFLHLATEPGAAARVVDRSLCHHGGGQ